MIGYYPSHVPRRAYLAAVVNEQSRCLAIAATGFDCAATRLLEHLAVLVTSSYYLFYCVEFP